MQSRSIRAVIGLLVLAVLSLGYAGLAQAKDNKQSTADKMVKRIQEDIKGYEQKLKAAEERMKAANSDGEKIEPLIKPTEVEMLRWKESMDQQQDKRAKASHEMQAKFDADPKVKAAGEALEKALAQRERLAAKLMPKIEAEQKYQELEAKRDASAKHLDKVKRENRTEDVPYAATALARDQGALGTYVQDELSANAEYKAEADAVDAAQVHKRTTEKEAMDRYRTESGLASIDGVYEEQQSAYRESREKLRDLERTLNGLRSEYKDAEKDAAWARQRIKIAKSRIETLQRKR